jgi:hypothetical protein
MEMTWQTVPLDDFQKIALINDCDLWNKTFLALLLVLRDGRVHRLLVRKSGWDGEWPHFYKFFDNWAQFGFFIIYINFCLCFQNARWRKQAKPHENMLRARFTLFWLRLVSVAVNYTTHHTRPLRGKCSVRQNGFVELLSIHLLGKRQ